jgi:hypothetical protein
VAETAVLEYDQVSGKVAKENWMSRLLSHSKEMARVLVGTAVIALNLWIFKWVEPAMAAPPLAAGFGSHASSMESARYYRRSWNNPPVYPYFYKPGRPGGWSFYFGFVPYARGNYEVQALQRLYPQTNWPPSMRYYPY